MMVSLSADSIHSAVCLDPPSRVKGPNLFPKSPASITPGDPLPEETQASLSSLLDLNLFQTEAVSVLSALEVAVVNHSLLKINKNQ